MNYSSSEHFLLDFHKKFSGCTPDSFASGVTHEKKNSYDLLAEVLPLQSSSPIQVLDLACGDGALLELISQRRKEGFTFVGLDMSEGELGAARLRLASSGINLIQGNAKSLPFSDQSFDFVLCHMAFMLMDQLEDVVSEIHRVLKPGGTFSAVVNAKREHSMPMKAYLRLLDTMSIHELKALPPIGDQRARTEEGLKSLFSKQFFKVPGSFKDFALHFYNSPRDLIPFFMLMYPSGRLSEDEREVLQSKLLCELELMVDSRGKVEHFYWLRQIAFQRRI